MIATNQFSKILFMSDNPIISTYNNYASAMSVISNDPQIWPWFHSNFIQLAYDKTNHWCHFENHKVLDTCIWLDRIKLSRNLVEFKWNSLREFIVDAINLNYYLYFYVDNYYLLPSSQYQKFHFSHEIFVYGYDLENDHVYLADNFDGKYVHEKCSFNVLEEAYRKADRDPNVGFSLYKKIKNEYNIFNLDYVIKSLRCFLESKPTMNEPTLRPLFEDTYMYEYTYGLDVYNEFIHNIDLCRNDSDILLDIRSYHLLWEHKTCMVLRILYMIESSILIDGDHFLEYFKQTQIKTLILRNLALKYNISKNVEIINKIKVEIEKIKDGEKVIIEQLCDSIQQKSLT